MRTTLVQVGQGLGLGFGLGLGIAFEAVFVILELHAGHKISRVFHTGSYKVNVYLHALHRRLAAAAATDTDADIDTDTDTDTRHRYRSQYRYRYRYPTPIPIPIPTPIPIPDADTDPNTEHRCRFGAQGWLQSNGTLLPCRRLRWGSNLGWRVSHIR